MKLIAHRGIHSKHVVENSKFAHKTGLSSNDVCGIELDVRLTKDLKLVCFHDDSLMRLTGKTGFINHCDFSKLNSIYLLNNFFKEPIYLIKDILDYNTDKLILIDVKCENNFELISELLTELLSNYRDKNIYVMSDNKQALKFLNVSNRSYKLGALLFFELKDEESIKKLDFIAIKKNFINKQLVEECIKDSKEVMTFTINKKEEINALKNECKEYFDDIYIISNLIRVK